MRPCFNVLAEFYFVLIRVYHVSLLGVFLICTTAPRARRSCCGTWATPSRPRSSPCCGGSVAWTGRRAGGRLGCTSPRAATEGLSWLPEGPTGGCGMVARWVSVCLSVCVSVCPSVRPSLIHLFCALLICFMVLNSKCSTCVVQSVNRLCLLRDVQFEFSGEIESGEAPTAIISVLPPPPPPPQGPVTRTRRCMSASPGSSGGWSVWCCCWLSSRTATCRETSSWSCCRYARTNARKHTHTQAQDAHIEHPHVETHCPEMRETCPASTSAVTRRCERSHAKV